MRPKNLSAKLVQSVRSGLSRVSTPPCPLALGVLSKAPAALSASILDTSKKAGEAVVEVSRAATEAKETVVSVGRAVTTALKRSWPHIRFFLNIASDHCFHLRTQGGSIASIPVHSNKIFQRNQKASLISPQLRRDLNDSCIFFTELRLSALHHNDSIYTKFNSQKS